MFKFFSRVKNVNLACSEEVGVTTDSLTEGFFRGEFVAFSDRQRLSVL